jgi:hypothetical protein
MSHTPGPWSISEYSPHTVVAGDPKGLIGGCVDPDREAERYVKVVHGMGNCDCGTLDRRFHRTRLSVKEADANARLIAAAPDLLAALRGMLKQYPHLESAATFAAEAAIAKAEGR